ncbi:MAG: SGNH/GDSL hydrolase family protein [Planctomycetia bacterium]|nr:SGNH/GDSL hydrolase family protein [Planctomycetia bacterium]
MRRRTFFQSVLAGTVVLAGNRWLGKETLAVEPVRSEDGKKWFDWAKLPLEGRAWEGEERATPFGRFPKRWLEQMPPAVASLSTHSAGMVAHFQTNAKQIWLRCAVTDANLAMPHMPATGKSGFDLYGRDTAGKFRFIKNVVPKEGDLPLGENLPGDEREYLIYLPLYNGTRKMELGLPENASFSLVERKEKPILFYGTSIMHGGCASRPGMPHAAILGRRLDRAFWNFGFSGNGRMEVVLAEAFGELDAAIYVLDCLPNMNPKLVSERTVPFVRKLREKRPDTPILLVEDRVFPNAWIYHGQADYHQRNQASLKSSYEKLLADGVPGLFYLSHESLLSEDGDATVDNSHPTDYGFLCYANAMEGILREMLEI